MSAIRALLRGAVARDDVAGAVAVVSRGDVVAVETAGVQDLASGMPMRRDTIVRIASMTKPILAAAALILVDEGRIALDDPVDRWLPELSHRRVLRTIAAALDDTVPAMRAISLRDLVTLRFGLGLILAPPGTYAIQSAMVELGLAPGPDHVAMEPDAYMARMGRLPLAHQPGECWMYHTGSDVLAVLIARVAGRPLGDVLAERLFGPLGMTETGFHVPEASLDRLATAYALDPAGARVVWDEGRGGRYARPPPFPSELVSTADDYLAFARMLMGIGPHRTLLSTRNRTAMVTDQITPEQKAASPFAPGFWETRGWGFGGAIVTRRDDSGASPGSYGWSGGFGTHFLVDGAEGLVVVLLTQQLMRGPEDIRLAVETFRLAYAGIAH